MRQKQISLKQDVYQSLQLELRELRQKVLDLEQENIAAHRTIQRHKILLDIIQKIRESLNLETIFQATVTQVREFLQADRVGIFRFEPYSNHNLGQFVSEDVVPDYSSALDAQISDHCFGEQYAVKYQEGRMQVVSNIYEAGLTPCHIDILAQFQVIANLVVPLLFNGKLWGLLCVHQCSAPRHWQEQEIDLIQRLADQLSVGIQHAEVVGEVEQTVTELQTIFSAFPDLYFRITPDTTIIDFHAGYQENSLYLPPEMFLGKRAIEIMPPTVAAQIEQGVQELQETQSLVAFEYSLCLTNRLEYYEGRLIPLGNDQIIAIVRNITERKEAERALQESEARFQKIAASVPGMLYQLRQEPDGQMCFTYASPGCRELLGVEPDQIEEVWTLIHPEDAQALREQTYQSSQTLQSFNYEWRTILPSGTIKWVQAISRPEKQPDGSIVWDGLMIDITERKQAKSERDRFFQLSADWFCISGFDGYFRRINPACEKTLGYTKAELLAEPFISFVHLDDQAATLAEAAKLSEEGGTTIYFENRYRCRDGSYRWIAWSSTASLEDGVLYSTARDITEQKQIEDTLRQQAQIIDQVHDGVVSVDLQGFINFWNKGAERLLGYTASEIQGKPISLVHIPEERESFQNDVIQPVLANGFHEIELWLQHKSGQRFLAHLSLTLRRDYEGNVVGIIGSALDITERKQAEEKLRQSEQRYQLLTEASPICVFYTDAEGDCLYTNNRWQNIAGLSQQDALGKGWSQMIHPEDKEDVFTHWYQVAQNQEPFYREVRFLRPDGQVSWVITQAVPTINEAGETAGYVGTITDITDRKRVEIQLQQKTQDLEQTLENLKRTQSQLIQSEKMSSLGQLVAGVAHEINNPVNFIHGNLIHAEEYTTQLLELIRLYQAYYPEPVAEISELAEEVDLEFLIEDLPKLLGSMQVGTKRIREIVASLRNFSRLDESEVKEVNIHEGLDNTLMILQNRLKAKPNHPGIEVIKHYEKLPLVQCYPGQLNQVFMNILVNAIDALEEYDKSRTYSEIEQNPSIISIITEWWQSTSQICIKIKDNGPGISETVQSRIFDPFFTTKAIGKGTGLGMSISYQIITERHQGILQCNSTVGEGAEFVILIPVQKNNI